MKDHRLSPMRCLSFLAVCCLFAASACAQVPAPIAEQLRTQQLDLATTGKAFLLAEANRANFFMLGELHGETEIPALLREIWPPMWRSGYRHIAAEMSPWAAAKFESLARSPGGKSPGGLWTQAEVDFVRSAGTPSGAVVWGCDIEEGWPEELVKELAKWNPSSPAVKSMLAITAERYKRSTAPALLKLATEATGLKDGPIGGFSLLRSLIDTLEVESARLQQETRLKASEEREAIQKKLFMTHYRASSPAAKVMLRFGRNHLHRGYDRRGVSTLANFVAEFAAAQGLTTFNVATFGVGGQLWWGGALLDWDERKDDPAFEFLAALAQHSGTVFDLRPIRQALHRIPEDQRQPVIASLIYWADSYDAIICYRQVTPIRTK